MEHFLESEISWIVELYNPEMKKRRQVWVINISYFSMYSYAKLSREKKYFILH